MKQLSYQMYSEQLLPAIGWFSRNHEKWHSPPVRLALIHFLSRIAIADQVVILG
jgi:hypothetical protein